MEKLMIEKSYELLHEFFSTLDKKYHSSVGLMGGWAVHYTLKNKDTIHMGSRDIDIFFDTAKVKANIIEQKLEEMGFHRHSTFRWVKIFHSETEKQLGIEESKKHALHNLSYIYFDIATPTKIKHSMPEPLLKKVFEGDLAHVKIKGTLVMVPSAKTLIEMKLKSVVNRNDAFKRTKDLVDLHGLLDSHKELLSAKPK